MDSDFITISKAIQRSHPSVESLLTGLVNQIEDSLETPYESDMSKAVDYEVRLNSTLAGLYVALERMRKDRQDG